MAFCGNKKEHAMLSQNNHGLTLVEVIVLAVIVLVTAALVLPTLASNKTGGRRTSCASNLNQIGKAMFMYADVPGNDVFPTTSTNKDDPFACNAPLAAWGLLYNKYVADPRVFSCPSKPTVSSELQAWMPGQPVPTSCRYAYDPGHSPNDAVASIAGDIKGSGPNSNNHGANEGQNVLIGAGTVEFRDTVINRTGNDEQDDDIYSLNPKITRANDGYLRQ
jgi:type II secretory pathway pseudopilin PulG